MEVLKFIVKRLYLLFWSSDFYEDFFGLILTAHWFQYSCGLFTLAPEKLESLSWTEIAPVKSE